MSNSHEVPEAIQWHEGMLLGPQHLQQHSLRQEELLHYHAALMAPYHWGVNHLRIDPKMLIDGKFRVVELEAVMPDGLVISSLHREIAEETVDLEPFKAQMSSEPVTLHLAVPAKSRSGAPQRGELARFDSVEGGLVTDINTGEGEIRIPRLRPRVTLMVGETPPEKYVSFPLAQVAYEAESYVLADFVPPLLRVAADPRLGDICSGISTRLREKAAALAEKTRSPSMASKAPQLLESRSRVHALVSGLPHFEALLGSGVAHPYAVYLSLCSLVGNLATLGPGLIPPVFKPYNHNDLRAAFEQARRFVERVITEGFIESFTGYPFGYEAGTYSLRFDPAWSKRRLILGVRARAGTPEVETATWLEDSLIGSESVLPSMRQRRVLGAERARVEAEDDLVPTPGVSLFALTPQPDAVKPDEVLMIFNPDDPEGRRGPAEIVLYVRKKS